MDTSAEIRVALEEASRGVGRGAWATLLVGANAPTYVKLPDPPERGYRGEVLGQPDTARRFSYNVSS